MSGFASVLRPNYRRARELTSEIEDVMADKEVAEAAGNFSQVQDLNDLLHELQHALFLTGVTSEYDL